MPSVLPIQTQTPKHPLSPHPSQRSTALPQHHTPVEQRHTTPKTPPITTPTTAPPQRTSTPSTSHNCRSVPQSPHPPQAGHTTSHCLEMLSLVGEGGTSTSHSTEVHRAGTHYTHPQGRSRRTYPPPLPSPHGTRQEHKFTLPSPSPPPASDNVSSSIPHRYLPSRHFATNK